MTKFVDARWSYNKLGRVVIHANSWSNVRCPYCGRYGRASFIKYCIEKCLLERKQRGC